jgi:hypothetical protein
MCVDLFIVLIGKLSLKQQKSQSKFQSIQSLLSKEGGGEIRPFTSASFFLCGLVVVVFVFVFVVIVVVVVFVCLFPNDLPLLLLLELVSLTAHGESCVVVAKMMHE